MIPTIAKTMQKDTRIIDTIMMVWPALEENISWLKDSSTPKITLMVMPTNNPTKKQECIFLQSAD